MQRNRAEPVVEVLPKQPLTDHRLEIAVGRGDQADVDLDLGSRADAAERRRVEDAEQLDLRRQADLADFVEKDRAAVRDFEQARFGAVGAGKGAPLVSEQLTLQQAFLQSPAVDDDERALTPRTARVQELGDHFLSRPGLANDQHGRIGRAHPFDQREQTAEFRALADERASQIRRRETALEQRRALTQRLALDRALNAHLELVDRARLPDIVERPNPDGLDGRIDRAVTGEHDDVNRGVAVPDRLQRVQTAHARQVQVEEDDVRL